MTVVGVDLLGQGEFSTDGKPWVKARLNNSGHNDGPLTPATPLAITTRSLPNGSTTCFRQFRLPAIRWAPRRSISWGGRRGHWVLAARPEAGAAIDRAAADTAGFRFARLTAIDDPDFLPGGAKYLDLPGIAALSAGLPLWLAGEPPAGSAVISAAYEAAGTSVNLVRFSGETRNKRRVPWSGSCDDCDSADLAAGY